MKPYEALFDPASSEASVWHGLPMGLHAWGLMHAPAAGGAKAASIVDTTVAGNERSNDPLWHWPSLTHGTVYWVLYDAINIYLEGDGIDRRQFTRTGLRWFPSHLDMTWSAGGIEVRLRVAMIDGDCARVRADVSNRSDKPWSGRLIVEGDANVFNCTAHGQTWSKGEGEFRWHDQRTPVVSKKVGWGLQPPCFPYPAALKPEDQWLDWRWMHYRLAFCIGGDGWQAAAGGPTWQLRRELTMAEGGDYTFEIGVAGRWLGKNAGPVALDGELAAQATEALHARSFDQIAAANRAFWEAFYAKVPALKGQWPPEIVRLYYKAWTAVYYNTAAPADFVLHEFRHPIGTCNKIGASSMTLCPASWESSLIAMLMALVDPALGCQLMEAVYEPLREDGYLSELPGNVTVTQLPAVEPITAWICYRLSNDREFLKRIYDPLRRNLLYKALNPTWGHAGPQMVRNYAYVHVGARLAREMARELGRSERELEEWDKLIAASRGAVAAFWDDEGGYYRVNFLPALSGGPKGFENGTEADGLIPIYQAATPDKLPRLLELLRNEFLTPEGVVARKPRTLPRASSATYGAPNSARDFTIKEGNWIVLAKGIKDADRELFDTIVRGTLANIRKAGDFHEGYTVNGEGRHNGPGTIFGALAVIWMMLLSEDQVDHLYGPAEPKV